jgi:hypothetical protein
MLPMKVHGTPTRTIWPVAGADAVEIIDQTALPHSYRVLRLDSLDDVAQAIRSMQVRGAPLIGVSAAYGVALALARRADDATLAAALQALAATRPTAVNLHWALARLQACLLPLPPSARAAAAWLEAGRLAEEDVQQCRRIGEHGLRRAARTRRCARAHRDHDPLQRRLAGDRRSRYGAGTGLCRIRPGNRHPCLGFRNASAQPGPADRLGTP